MTAVLDRPMSLDQAIARAEDFLLARQDANGGWRDFLLPAGLSDAWVTGYVGEALVGSPEGEQATRRGWAFLHETEAASGGWSYNSQVPGDADSTLWGLRLAEAIGEGSSPLARRGYAFLERHLRPDHGLSTYASAGPIRAYTGLPELVPFDGWTQSHVCVSAAGANLPRYAARIVPYLLARQDADGSWPGYFWFDREYATGEALVALAANADHCQAIERGVRWLSGRVDLLAATESKARPAFALACAARALALVDGSASTRAAGARLAEWQRPDGSWGPSARLRVPRPDAIDPPSGQVWTRWQGLPADAVSPLDRLNATFTNFSPDHRGVFGAATALRALRAIARGDAA